MLREKKTVGSVLILTFNAGVKCYIDDTINKMIRREKHVNEPHVDHIKYTNANFIQILAQTAV